MAVVLNIKFYLVDTRHKYLIKKNKLKTEKQWISAFPLEIFLHSDKNTHTFFYSNTINNATTLFSDISSKDQVVKHNLLLSSLSSIYTYIDASCYNTPQHLIYLSSFSCLYHHTRISFVVKMEKNSQFCLISSSHIFLSSQWLERELREFFNILFVGLADTRRLLTDYTLLADSLNNYKTESYDIITQDLYAV